MWRQLLQTLLLSALLLHWTCAYQIELKRRQLSRAPLYELNGTSPIRTDIHRIGYTLDLKIGGQGPFQLTFDTGSANLAVDTVQCGGCVGNDRYSPSASPTAKPEPPCRTTQQCWQAMGSNYSNDLCDAETQQCVFQTLYVDGSGWVAVAYIDTVQLPVFIPGEASITSAGVGAIRSMSGQQKFGGVNIDGITGWAYASNCAFGETLWDSYRAANHLPDIFSMCMGWDGGVLVLGTTDHELMDNTSATAPLSYTAIDSSRGFYGVNLVSVRVVPPNNRSLAVEVPMVRSPDDHIGPIIDTGSTWIHLPSYNYNAIKLALSKLCDVHKFDWPHLCNCNVSDPSNCFFTTSCLLITEDQLKLWPILEWVFEPLEGHAPAVVPVPADKYMTPGTNPPTREVWCRAFDSFASNINLGDPFFRSTFITFERNQNRVGFAAPSRACATT